MASVKRLPRSQINLMIIYLLNRLQPLQPSQVLNLILYQSRHIPHPINQRTIPPTLKLHILHAQLPRRLKSPHLKLLSLRYPRMLTRHPFRRLPYIGLNWSKWHDRINIHHLQTIYLIEGESTLLVIINQNLSYRSVPSQHDLHLEGPITTTHFS